MKKILFLLIFLLPSCALQYQHPGPAVQAPELTAEAFISADGHPHAITRWAPPNGTPFAVVVGVHGFNDYRKAFDLPGKYLSENGILVLAYDQRGFGADEKPGFWPGRETLKSDLLAFLGLVRAENPGVPVFVMGESMGGAVGLYGLSGSDAADGLILIAPAVWGWRPVNIVYRPAIWLTAHIMPGKKFSGKNLHLKPSDNVAVMIEMYEDPLVIKKTRLDAIYGLSRLMKYAIRAAPDIRIPTYLLYGEKDQMVPEENSEKLWRKLPEGLKERAVYPGGYHLLLRDCGAGRVWQDVLRFIGRQSGLLVKVAEPPETLCKTEGDKE